MKKTLTLSLVLITMGCLAGCQTKQTGHKNADQKTSVTSKPAHEKIDYEDQKKWDFVSGKMQSPIDIKTSQVAAMTPDDGNLTLAYDQTIKKVENNGHSIQVTDGGESMINGRHFKLTQFHFHAASEHTVDGKHYPMEAHFVNTSQDGRLAVIAVFFIEGAENNGFKEVLADVASHQNQPIQDIDQMMPENKGYYHYLGSLTTPPLTENVEWYVMKTPVEISKSQLASFKKLYDHNNREVQPLNGRKIFAHDAS